MTKEELFKKYSVNETHSVWDDSIDNWMSVEIYRLMHNGNLPPREDKTVKWVTDYLNKFKDDSQFAVTVMQRKDWGSLFLTAKRMVYKFSEQLCYEGETNN